MSIFQLGDFVLNSGTKSAWKLECDALSDSDWQTLALMIDQMVGPFGSVEGVPRGGLRLAAYLAPFANGRGPRLLVDDVLTTGGSMERACSAYLKGKTAFPDGPLVIGAVVFARGPCPSWIKPIFQMPEALWIKK